MPQGCQNPAAKDQVRRSAASSSFPCCEICTNFSFMVPFLQFLFCKKNIGKDERTWTSDTYAPYDDGHQWRKYGEKKLSNSNFPRFIIPPAFNFLSMHFVPWKSVFFSFSPSMHPLCVQELLLLLSRYSCRKWSIQLLLDLEWICGTCCCVNWRVITWNIWILGTPLPCFDWKYSWFLIDLASSNINKGDSYMLPIYFLNVASRPHHVIKLQFLHYLK